MTIGILHTTESDPGTAGGVISYLKSIGGLPHYVSDPSTGLLQVTSDLTTFSKALLNAPGGVETNRRDGGVIQVEIVARSSEVGGYSPEWYDKLRDQLAEISLAHGIAWQYREDKTRLTFDQWVDPNLVGWLGHCHVPENTHWDPGTLNTRRIFSKPLTPQGLTDMAALEDTTPVEYHPGGDRSKAVTTAPVVNAIGWVVDASAAAEAAALRVEAAVARLSQPVQLSDVRNIPTPVLLAEVARRLGA